MHTEQVGAPAPLRRREVEPSAWRADPRFAAATEVSSATRLLVTGLLGPTDEAGAVLHEHDAVAQVALSVANLEQVLAAAGMGLRDVLRLEIATVDLDTIRAHLDLVVERFGACGCRPALCLLTVAALPQPGALLNLQVVAAA